MPRYDAKRIEARWQAYWEAHQTFHVEMDTMKPKLYVLDMFPYPSGDGLHVGHPEGYTATDIVCRYSRMLGKNVLHPMGWDAFGLPAEQHAIKTGTHPRVTTEKNIGTFKRQLKSLGFSFDWSREIATTDPDYVRWTQWIFLQLFDTWYDPDYPWTGPDGVSRVGKGRPIAELPIPGEVRAAGETAVRKYQDEHRLAYIHYAPVNWCPQLGTVLANEEVIDGKSEVGGFPVERRPLRQWMLRITAYAERLIDELEPLQWSESIKVLQRNWIGKSVGAEVDFLVESSGVEEMPSPEFDAWKASRAQSGFPAAPEPGVIRVYTTRPDTLYGVTYMVLAPEHPLVDQITTTDQKAAVDAYRQKAALKSDLDRTDLAKEKTGVFTGGYAINPVNGEQVPVWIADYVLISYGTGAIMAVPAHDERDFEFAQQFGIDIKPVVAPEAEGSPSLGFFGEGIAINSGAYTGLPTAEFKSRITADLAQQGLGKEAVNYRLRDWLFSRQRYWGEPFPIWHELDANGEPTGMVRAVSTDQLPVALPEMEDFQPTGTPEPLLSKAPESWLYATAPDGTQLKRETNSMPQWAGSCWYYLRFCDNKNSDQFIDPAKEKYWLPVDLYIGGAEHAVLHLLYSRFWHKVLFDLGHVTTPEPFARLVNQGMILGEPEYFGYNYYPEDADSTIKVLKAARTVISDIGMIGEDGGKSDAGSRSLGVFSLHHRLLGRHNSVPTIRSILTAICQRRFPGKNQVFDNVISRISDQIRRDEANDYRTDLGDPIKWFNNERGVVAIRRLFETAIQHAKKEEVIWVACDRVHPSSTSRTGFLTHEQVPVVRRPIPKKRVELRQGKPELRDVAGARLESQSSKMSKSRGNVINPDLVVEQYGADSLRLYEMFMGPLEATKPWSMQGVDGIYRFLGRVWRLMVEEKADDVALNSSVQDVAPTAAQLRTLHKTIKAVTEDLDKLSFNTAISRMMEFTNEFTSQDVRPKSVMEAFVLLLSPFAPHLAEELWELLGHTTSLAHEPWPQFDAALLVESEIEVPVQVNGKVRGKVTVPAGSDQATVEAAAKAHDTVASNLAGKTIVKVVYVPGKLLNMVVK